MKAAVIRSYGTNDVVVLENVDRPQPGPGEVLVKVGAAGVNPIDWKIRNGAGQRLGLTLPIRLGRELVGTVDSLGPGVRGFSAGESVYGMVESGSFAEYAVAKADDLVRPPTNLDAAHAAALPLAGTTAWHALFDEAGLRRGQRLLITNSSGGVGSLALQFAKAVGAHVTAVASGRNEEFVRGLGADAFIDYTAGPFEQDVRDMDVVLDTVGGETFLRAYGTLAARGILVTVVAFPDAGRDPGGVRVVRSSTVPNAETLRKITDMVEAGSVGSSLEAVFPLQDVRQALARSEGGHARGKVVVAVGP